MRPFAALLFASCALLLAACGKKSPAPSATAPGAAPAPVKIRFLTDWYPQAEHGGFYQAIAKGFYRDAGLDVEIIPGGPGVPPNQKLMAGDGDITMGRSDDVIVQTGTGLPILMVASFMQHDPQAILVHADSPVHAFPDLDGHSVMAVPGANWIAYLKNRYKIDFNLIPINFGIAQFMSDPNFIQQCFVTNEPYYVREKGQECRTLLIADSGYDPYRGIVTTKRFAREHPDALRAFVAASIKGWADFMHGDPTPGEKLILAARADMTPGFIAYSIKAMQDLHLVDGDPAHGDRLGRLDPKRLQDQVDLLVRLKIISSPAKLTDFASFDFLPAGVQPAGTTP